MQMESGTLEANFMCSQEVESGLLNQGRGWLQSIREGRECFARSVCGKRSRTPMVQESSYEAHLESYRIQDTIEPLFNDADDEFETPSR